MQNLQGSAKNSEGDKMKNESKGGRKPPRVIKSHKGGRSEQLHARLTVEEKAEVMAKVKADGYKSFSDWLMAQVKRG